MTQSLKHHHASRATRTDNVALADSKRLLANVHQDVEHAPLAMHFGEHVAEDMYSQFTVKCQYMILGGLMSMMNVYLRRWSVGGPFGNDSTRAVTLSSAALSRPFLS